MTLKERLYLQGEALLLFLCGWVPTGIGTLLRRFAYIPFFYHCGSTFRAGTHTVIQGFRNIGLGCNVCLNRHTSLYSARGYITIGNNVFLGDFSSINANDAVITIGSDVAIGPMTIIQGANHNFDDLDEPIIYQGHIPNEIVIEDNVWIAAHCTILPGVHIHSGAVIGAGSIVTKDVPKNAIMGGAPARILRFRGIPKKTTTTA